MKKLKRAATFFVLLVWPLTPFGCAKAEPQTVVIDHAACQYLTRHFPAPDVEYQPGVDAHGKAVAPADLAGTQTMKLPEDITINLTPDIVQWLPSTDYPFDKLAGSEIDLGKIVLSGDRVTYNGQPLTDPAQEQLAVLCLQPAP
ncbi:MAG: hypothetical protein GC131_01690 [Alphaproteobacteria bacterium]|nr:hypothetical protein [Alphaproteobacteria bacterium]